MAGATSSKKRSTAKKRSGSTKSQETVKEKGKVNKTTSKSSTSTASSKKSSSKGQRSSSQSKGSGASAKNSQDEINEKTSSASPSTSGDSLKNTRGGRSGSSNAKERNGGRGRGEGRGRGRNGNEKNTSTAATSTTDPTDSGGRRSAGGRGGGRNPGGRGGGRSVGGHGGGRNPGGCGGGRNANGRGGGTGGSRRQSSSSDEYACLPESLKAFSNGWEEITTDSKYEVVMKDDYNGIENSTHMCQIYENIADRVVRAINRKGVPLTTYSIFSHLLSNTALLIIVENTSEQLVIDGYAPTNLLEFKVFLGTRWLRSRMRMSPELAFIRMQETARSSGFILMTLSRYKQIYQCIRGFAMSGRHEEWKDYDKSTWMKRGVMLRQLAPLEKEVFVKSIGTLLNQGNAHLVIDDELIGSRAKDVENKSVSNRKAGKEGPTADCIACSFTSIMYGVRLRVRGEKMVENIHALVDTLPRITTSDANVRLSFDRGYGTMKFIEETTSKNYKISTIATTVGSRHPFLPKTEMEKFIKTCLDKGDTANVVGRKVGFVY